MRLEGRYVAQPMTSAGTLVITESHGLKFERGSSIEIPVALPEVDADKLFVRQVLP